MRIAFVGKGGSGKTTACALFGRYLNSINKAVILVDADINQHLGYAFGIDSQKLESIPCLGNNILEIKKYLSGTNTRISDPKLMQKTTPPGIGSVLLNFSKSNLIWNKFLYDCNPNELQNKQNLIFGLLKTGEFKSEDIGVSCYHAKTGAVELLLNHLIDNSQEYFLVDMTAGADAFASGLFTKFDLTLIVTEATKQSVGVYRQYKSYASDYSINIKALGNKVTSPEDLRYLEQELGEDLLTTLPDSKTVRLSARFTPKSFDSYETSVIESLKEIYLYTELLDRDWFKMYNQAVEIHIKNALSWANAITGCDLRKQIDPNIDGSIYIKH